VTLALAGNAASKLDSCIGRAENRFQRGNETRVRNITILTRWGANFNKTRNNAFNQRVGWRYGALKRGPIPA
jgi:hypothetical protein